MMAEAIPAAAAWLQEVPPRALVVGMAIAYLLSFAGLVFAYLSYRRRRGDRGRREHKQDKGQK